VTLRCRSIDRIFLQAYVPKLQSVGEVCIFLRWQRKFPIPSSAAFGKIGDEYVKAVYRFAETHRIPVVHFKKGQNKEEVARPYLEAAARQGNDQVVLIGIAQEKASVWRSWPRKGQDKARHPHMDWGREMAFLNHFYFYLWDEGVSSQGHMFQSVRDRPRRKDSGLVAREAPWRENKTAGPSDNILRKECAQRTRLQRAVNVDVASLQESPVAETVLNARKQQGLTETSPMRQLSPAGYQRQHGVKEDVETGETLGARRANLVAEVPAITVSGKCRHRRQGGGSGRSYRRWARSKTCPEGRARTGECSVR
jgi:hypothetical protein